MSEARPLWRQLYDSASGSATPLVASLYGSEPFAVVVGAGTQVQQAVQSRVERVTRHVLHQLNLPAGSDVTRVLREISKLRSDVAALSDRLDRREGGEDAPDRTADTTRADRARPA
jgi:hypothetical protein